MCQCQIRSYFLRISVMLPIEKINGKCSEFVIGARFRYDWQIVFILVFFYIKISTYTLISSNIIAENLIILHGVTLRVRVPPLQLTISVTSFNYVYKAKGPWAGTKIQSSGSRVLCMSQSLCSCGLRITKFQRGVFHFHDPERRVMNCR